LVSNFFEMLQAQHISKTFAGIKALNDVSITLKAGEVHAIIGANGAGKSTLMKVLSGVYSDYEGQILWQNKPVKFSGTKAAQAQGIAIIHQELNLISELSITENIFLGHEMVTYIGILNRAQMRQKTMALLQKLRINIDPDAPIKTLKVGQQQLIEIAKALLVNAQVIIMDEPTSAITGAEAAVLFGIIETLKKEGKAIAYISHKLDELFKIADTYTILRDGQSIESGLMTEISSDQIVSKMVGKTTDYQPSQKTLQTTNNNETIFEVQDLTTAKDSKESISFSLKKGEILGIFGLMGAGRTELFEAIFGLNIKKTTRKIWINGQQKTINSPAEAVKAGLAFVSEDRKKDGIVPELSVKQNISLTTIMDLLKGGVVRFYKEQILAEKYISELQIKVSSGDQVIKNLSGGNQQKVILAKWLATNPKVLMLDEPTRGIDINAKHEIYKLMRQLADSGVGVLMVSSELSEILTVSDRVLVLSEGKLTGDFKTTQATEEHLLKAAIA
jgi:ribose transport system ATP-binding protein